MLVTDEYFHIGTNADGIRVKCTRKPIEILWFTLRMVEQTHKAVELRKTTSKMDFFHTKSLFLLIFLLCGRTISYYSSSLWCVSSRMQCKTTNHWQDKDDERARRKISHHRWCACSWMCVRTHSTAQPHSFHFNAFPFQNVQHADVHYKHTKYVLEFPRSLYFNQ